MIESIHLFNQSIIQSICSTIQEDKSLHTFLPRDDTLSRFLYSATQPATNNHIAVITNQTGFLAKNFMAEATAIVAPLSAKNHFTTSGIASQSDHNNVTNQATPVATKVIFFVNSWFSFIHAVIPSIIGVIFLNT